ncbi:MAG: tetratricopeptide repeat protein [Brevundimonas sp.]|uniref:tetratricopeptide repeat protein n=1 Tax=Brevundimonas sp. TaxID=1871086 RepID=UPI00391A6CA1
MSIAFEAPAALPGLARVAAAAAGDAASPEAVGRLSRVLARDGGKAKKQARAALAQLKAAVADLRVHDYQGASRKALKALEADSQSGVAWHVLAIAREKAGDLVQALNAYEAALKLLPQDTAVAQDLARLAQRLGYLEIAEKLLLHYLAADPDHIEAINNLACVLRDQNRYDEAVEVLRARIQTAPDSALMWNTLGTVLGDQGDMAAALTFYDEALRLKPDFAKARYNRGNARQPLGDFEGALEDLEAALPHATPGYETAMMTMARALTLMTAGRLKEGFEAYEVRLDPAMPDAISVVADGPRWTPGQPLEGKRILVVGEQGIADEFIFANTLPDLIRAVGPGGQVFLAVEPRLVSIFQRSFPETVVGGHQAVRQAGRLIRFAPFMKEHGAVDGWAPMASLLAVFRPTIAAFPDHAGYMRADPERVARWRTELAALGEGFKVGLHWKSLVLKGVRSRYFSPFDQWRPVLTTPGCIMVNLQCGDTAAELAQAEAEGLRIWTPPINLKDDLEDVAALSVALDLVIGPGIAGTNIAAAVGANTWMIQAPDDWHLLGTGETYPFYPRMRGWAAGSFGRWDGVMAEMAAELARISSPGRNTA